MGLRSGLNLGFSKSYISAGLHQIFMKFFLVTLLWHESLGYFMVHVRTTHHFWEKRHGWNHGNPKMPLSLALFSDTGGISAMDQWKNLAMGLVQAFFWLFSQNSRTKISKLKPIYGKTQGFYLVTMTSSIVKINQNSRIYGKTQGFY